MLFMQNKKKYLKEKVSHISKDFKAYKPKRTVKWSLWAA